MAAKGNPNFLLPLFAPKESILKIDARGSQLRDMTQLFISKQAVRSHLGYMQGQRQRLLNHQREFGAGHGRGKPRTGLIEEFGYDTKFGMHLLRLGLQGVELLRSGRITLPIQDADRKLLLEVRAGKIKLEDVLRKATDFEDTMKKLYDDCPLQAEPDYNKIERWMTRIYFRQWSATRRIEDIVEDNANWQHSHIV